MSPTHLEPARGIIAKIGVEKVAELTGKHVSRVYRWMYPKDRGGTGGFIPHAEAAILLDYARQTGIPLSANEFFETPQPDRTGALHGSDRCSGSVQAGPEILHSGPVIHGEAA